MKKWSERESYYRGEKKKKKPNMHLQMLPFCDFLPKKTGTQKFSSIFFKILLEKKQEEAEKPFHLAVSDG